jgi:hypothetical protein
MDADNSSDLADDAMHFYSIAEAMKLITHSFDGDKRKLREFIENVDVGFELVDPSKNNVSLKFVKTKITGDARSKLMVRDNTQLETGEGHFRRKLRNKRYVGLLCMQDVWC